MIGEQLQLSELHQLDPPQRDRADIWLCRLDVSTACVEALHSIISSNECERAAKFLSDRARDRFIVGRAILRRLLAAYLSKQALAVELTIEAFGKPRFGDETLQFNLAHSGDWVLIGITSAGEIGVDIERRRPVAHQQEIAQRCFTTRELAELQSFATEKQQEMFFRAWTRKEAVVKWHGSGLQLPLKAIEVPLDDRCDAEVILPSANGSCWVRSLESPAGYSAALAISRPIASIVMRELIVS